MHEAVLVGSEEPGEDPDRSALKRWGTADDLVGPILFLCSPAANFFTGVTLPVDGGYSVGERSRAVGNRIAPTRSRFDAYAMIDHHSYDALTCKSWQFR